jgi:hypothetical protein
MYNQFSSSVFYPRNSSQFLSTDTDEYFQCQKATLVLPVCLMGMVERRTRGMQVHKPLDDFHLFLHGHTSDEQRWPHLWKPVSC